LVRALDDASAAVRRVALDAVDAIVDDAAARRRALEARLGDRQPYLRELAYQRLRALDGAFDLAAHYRRLLAAAKSGAELRAAVGGLASCGIEEDVLVVEPIATDARAKVRGAALQAMAVLDRDSVAFLLDGLIDPSRRVARAAARFLERRPRAGLAERLVAIVESDAAPTHARGYALDVLCSATSWVRLERLLRLTASASAQAAASARTRIETRAFLPPTDAERDAVERALEAAVLDAGHRAFVRGELDLWRPRR
jgi:hypothetical protein